MGVAGAATTWQNVILFLPITFAYASIPVMASLGSGLESKRRRSFLFITTTNTLLSLLFSVPVCLLSAQITRLYGPGFEKVQAVLPIFAATASVMAPIHVCTHALNAWGRAWIELALEAVWAAIAIFLTCTQSPLDCQKLASILLVSQAISLLLHGIVLACQLRTTEGRPAQA
jgi:O-antigen/teichoic acid export membrane protein